jgi:DNA-binding transcriptional regulator LsrR (DeoR family)
MLEGLGMLAARYMEQELKPNMVVAVASGTAVYETVRALNNNQHLDVTVVQVMGVIGVSNPYVDGAELVHLMASRLGGRYLYLQSPLVVKNARVRSNLLREPAIQQVLALGQQASIALVGIGTVFPGDSSLLRTGFFTQQMLEELTKAGAVGETCGHVFNTHGEPVISGVGGQIMSLGLNELKKIPTVIAVAGGDHKVAAIHGLLQGKFINVLVTDDQTALKLLEM